MFGVVLPKIASFSFRISRVSLCRFLETHSVNCQFSKSLADTNEWGSRKSRAGPVKVNKKVVSPADAEVAMEPLRKSVQTQGNLVRELKLSGAPKFDIQLAIAELKIRKKKLEEQELELWPTPTSFDRLKMEDLVKRRFFYDQSFAIYGGITGQYDFGPMGCSLKTNILNLWRQFFVMEEQMLEVDCSILTPEPVLKASGHVDRFADLMVTDLKTGECFRLDHLIKNHLEKLIHENKGSAEEHKAQQDIITRLDGMSKDEMGEVLKRYNMTSPVGGNELSGPVEFNLMFATQIGPTGLIKGFLRPETAQGIFVNFKRLLEFNHGKLPFAAAQIGNAFRNEISPRTGLLRVREFTMAEIEHFCDPNEKNHTKFDSVKSIEMLLYSACNQMNGESPKLIQIGEAVAKGLVANETLGYFIARIYEFLVKIGIDSSRLRFRQHMDNEMAHYATDCWDAEILTSYGWVECVGCADRSAYDLTQHSKSTGIKLVAEKPLKQPKTVNVTEILPNRTVIGKSFKKDGKMLIEKLSKLKLDEIENMEESFRSNGTFNIEEGGVSFNLTKDMITVKSDMKTIHVEEITPSVIEPSFGIGRIIYSLLEHKFCMREKDEQRCFFALPSVIAPIKCSVLPLSNKDEFTPILKQICADLNSNNVSHKVDSSSGSIGRRYARTDEIGVPYAITIDFDTLKSPITVTLRERDSMDQIRIPIEDVAGAICNLSLQKLSWSDMMTKYPKFDAK